MIGQEEDVGLELSLLLDRIRLGCQIALLDGFCVGNEGGRVECIRLDHFFHETMVDFHPLIK